MGRRGNIFPGLRKGDTGNLFSDSETLEQSIQQSDDIEDSVDDTDNDSEFDPEWSDDSDC